jgi:hypothetical protein
MRRHGVGSIAATTLRRRRGNGARRRTPDRRPRCGRRVRRAGGARGKGGGGRRLARRGLRLRGGRRSGSRYRQGNGRALREELQRVDVAVGFAGAADAEVHVRGVVLELAALVDRPELLSLRQAGARRDGHRSKMEERDGVAVGRFDRDRAAVSRKRAREANHAARGRQRRFARVAGDVDTAMLAGFVFARRYHERPQHGPRRGPAPRACRGREGERDYDRGGHGDRLCCQLSEHGGSLAGGSAVVKIVYNDPL